MLKSIALTPNTVSRYLVVVALLLLAFGLPALAQSVTCLIIEVGNHQGKAIDLLRQGKLDEAAHEAKEGLEVAEKTGSKQVLASAHSVLGKVYRRQNRYQESLINYQRALDYWKTEPGQGFNEAMILNNMAEEYKTMNQLDQALPLLLQAKSKISDQEMNYWAIMENLGNVYFKQGKLSDAETAWKKAVATAHKSTDYRSEIESLCGLALIYSKQGRKQELDSVVEKAIPLTQMRFGAADPRIAALKKLKSPGSQQSASQESDAIWETHMKEGMVALQGGRFADAEKPLQAALKEAGKPGGPDARLAISLSNLGVMHVKLGNFQQAEQYLQRGLPIARKAFGPQSPQVAAILDSLVPAYIKQGKLEQAEPILKEFIPIQEKTPGYSKEDVEAARGILNNLQTAIERRKQQH